MTLPVEKFIPDYDAMAQENGFIYYGFTDFNCKALTEAKWSILRVNIHDGTTYIRKWANGDKVKNLQFSERGTYSYKFLK